MALRPLFSLFLSGRLRQVSLYNPFLNGQTFHPFSNLFNERREQMAEKLCARNETDWRQSLKIILRTGASLEMNMKWLKKATKKRVIQS